MVESGDGGIRVESNNTASRRNASSLATRHERRSSVSLTAGGGAAESVWIGTGHFVLRRRHYRLPLASNRRFEALGTVMQSG